MKKCHLTILSMLVILGTMMSGCGLITTSDTDQDQNLVNTQVAMAFTQTAMAQPLAQPEQAVETAENTPEPAVVEEVIEQVEEETAEPTEITHTLIPGEPGWINKWFYDTDASKTASNSYVTGGDDFVANLWERPFTESEMEYRPDLDINKTEMSEDSNFYYVTVYPHAVHPDGGLPGIYGIEIDIDKDGRGDLLVTAQNPTADSWDIAGVGVYQDDNNDVGGSAIMRPDTSYGGDGYETVVFSANVLDDPDAAWARADLGAPSVTLAFKKSLLGSPTTFVWGVWAADNLLDPTMLDLHDHFTQEEAGSPYQAHSTYPVKAINLVDNTCRETYGFDATVAIPGLCQIPEQPTPTFTPQPTATNTPTQPPTGNIQVLAFDDYNNNGVYNSGEPYTIYSVTMSLHIGSCSASTYRSTSIKAYNFTGLTAGTYCVKITGGGGLTTPSQYLVSLPAGGSIFRAFGFYVIQ